jgi:choline dehydrogenase
MHDYVIVGAGSAGCVLASRLSADPACKVLLLEAGGSDSARDVRMPIAFGKLFKTAVDWAFYTEEQRHLNNRKMYWPRGKMVGGCGSMNAMIYIRGNHLDFDCWAGLGATGWDWQGVEHHFQALERDLSVISRDGLNPISRSLVEGAVECGFPRNRDFNGPWQDGFGFYRVTQRRGERHSPAAAFLRPALSRSNLTVETGAHATGIVLENGRAIGVRYVREGRMAEARAAAEVILAGGAVNSPWLLMLSGIGPSWALQDAGVPISVELPGVGQNLQDHPVAGVCYECTQPVSLARATLLGNVLQYAIAKSGPLTSNVAEAGGFVRTRSGIDRPDIQFHFAPAYYIEHGFQQRPGHGFTVGPTLVRPESRGAIALRSANPFAPPAIQPNYFGDDRDMRALIEGVRMARRIAESEAMTPLRGALSVPDGPLETDREIAAHIRANAETLYHPAGTCRIGADAMAVVDPQLRVIGVDGLRVADASVMPEVVTGNTNAASMMIGEKAAAMILGRDALATETARA